MDVRGPFNLMSPYTPLLSFVNYPNFYPAFSDSTSLQSWTLVGLSCIYDLVTSSQWKHSLLYKNNFNSLPGSFRYLQIAHFIQPIIHTHSSLDSLSLYEGICNSDPHAPRIISRLHCHLNSPPSSISSYAAQWPKDLKIDLVIKDWDDIWATTKSSSQNIIALKTNYKVLVRWYLVPVRIFVPGCSPVCFWGYGQVGTHKHIWWTCPVVQ